MTIASKWREWRTVASSDTVPTDHKPSRLAAATGIINVNGFEEIAFRMFGDGDNKNFSMVIVGWMENGPGQRIFSLVNTSLTGATTFTEQIVKTVGDSSDAWYEVDNYDFGDNIAKATTPIPSTAAINSHITLPTMGFPRLQALIVLDGGAAAGKVTAIYRPTKRLVSP